MKVKSSVAGLIVAASLFIAIGPAQALQCYFQEPGWHMVSKRCNIPAAENWQEYAGGIYLQPMPRGMMLMR